MLAGNVPFAGASFGFFRPPAVAHRLVVTTTFLALPGPAFYDHLAPKNTLHRPPRERTFGNLIADDLVGGPRGEAHDWVLDRGDDGDGDLAAYDAGGVGDDM